MFKQLRVSLSRIRRTGGLKFLYNRQLYYRGLFFDDELEVPSKEFIDNLDVVLNTLLERERLILVLRYLQDEPKSLARIAEIMGITKERVRQLEGRALQKLRQSERKQVLGTILKKSRCFEVGWI